MSLKGAERTVTRGNETVLQPLEYAPGAERKDAGKFFVPQNASESERLRTAARRFVEERGLVPPLSVAELDEYSSVFLQEMSLPDKYEPFARVLINNAAWQDTVAAIPFNRRTFLLPPCLRSRKKCRAEFDELGLMCEQCGSCNIGGLTAEAEKLGYTVLVAEGTSTVTNLIEKGMIDAVIGVSCMASLQRAFSHTSENAVPGIAIPLLKDGCDATAVDLEWVREAMHLTSDKSRREQPDIDSLKSEVQSWFSPGSLHRIMGVNGSEAEGIGLSWLAKSGKRWRPFLAALVCKTLQGKQDDAGMEQVRKIAVAVECFHKASLIHDDIEDNDDIRYGDETLHKTYGVPIALNTGDLLLGEGYRLTSECAVAPVQKAEMFAITANGHRDLSLGQGAELCWMRNPVPLSPPQVLDIFKMKTAPAFEVALRLGAVCGGADHATHVVLKDFSEALGIAYQVRDDIEDFFGNNGTDDLAARRLSLMLALAYENAGQAVKKVLGAAWCEGNNGTNGVAGIRKIVAEMGVAKMAEDMYEDYRQKAFLSLRPLKNVELKCILFRVLNKILGRTSRAVQPGDKPKNS